MNQTEQGRNRVIIEGIGPEIDAGRFPIKRVVGDFVLVEADVFTDGHDSVAAVLQYRFTETAPLAPSSIETEWQEVAMTPLVNDRWKGAFRVDQVGTYLYRVVGWVDRFFTWHHDLQKRVAAGQATKVDLVIGADLIEAVGEQANGEDRNTLQMWSRRLRTDEALMNVEKIAEDEDLEHLMKRCGRRDFATTSTRELAVVVDRERAGFSSWYEMFPRSASATPGKHGTLKDVEARLPYVAKMGFDVLYLPPIHPIGQAFRKGKNNTPEAHPDDVGSPWGIGSEEGGHKSIHPELGTLSDFQQLV
ncbi:MAG: DUF3416 domain-containing protein, partial [Planctomycetaceae bacterium]|nr:DUF3416 domain-containing protein [Planctomycetaceae bacterium]